MKTQALLTVTVTAAALIAGTAFGADIRIRSAEELINFSNNVKGGSSYEGTTVFLNNDIDFNETTSSKFTPIGNEITAKYFRGTFDGQGYTINNLTIKINDRHAGLFGYSKGLTIKNVVMGASCFIENIYEKYDDSAFFAGIIGECEANLGNCIIENSVNMADVLFSGKVESSPKDKRYSIGGGVYGRFASQNGFDAKMQNCANYGTITQTGTSPTTYIGGLRGGCHGSSSHVCSVENCLNAGNVSFSGTTDVLYIGGLGGKIYLNEISNTASIGMITTNMETDKKGALAGGISEGTTTMTNCVWTAEDTGMSSGYGILEDNGQGSSDTLSSSSSELNSTTLAILNSQSSPTTSGKKWILNSGRHTVQFFVNGALTMSANTALVQQPDMSGSGGSSFNGWYTDASCTSEYTTYETTGDLDLYGTYGVLRTIIFILNDTVHTQSQQSTGKNISYPDELFNRGHTFIGWNNTGIIAVPDYDITFTAQWAINNYSVTFDFDNGTSIDQILHYNDDIEFPEDLVKKGHTFDGWNNTNNITEMPDHDITFTAQWSINSYSVTFDFGNGTSIDQTLLYDEEIDFPEDITKKGYTFDGWNNTDNITEMPDYDITFTAQWSANSYSITFDFGNGTSATEIIHYNDDIDFPEDITKKGYMFIEWNNTDNITEMPDYDITFTAQWAINNYTVTFDFGNGTFATQSLQYNETITYPDDVTRHNHTFAGWNNTGITTVPDYDITFTAQWIYGELGNWIEIIFEKKDITEEEIQRMIERYGDYTFTIEKFGTDDDSNTVVIIKFEDVGEAKSFVEAITMGSDSTIIKKIDFIEKPVESLSRMIVPSLLFFCRYLFSLLP